LAVAPACRFLLTHLFVSGFPSSPVFLFPTRPVFFMFVFFFFDELVAPWSFFLLTSPNSPPSEIRSRLRSGGVFFPPRDFSVSASGLSHAGLSSDLREFISFGTFSPLLFWPDLPTLIKADHAHRFSLFLLALPHCFFFVPPPPPLPA